MSAQDPEVTTEGAGEPLPPPKLFPWRQLILGVLILLCGAAIGAGGAVVLTRQALIGTIQRRDRNAPELMRRMGDRLNLTPEQRKQVEAIVSQRMGAVRQIREEVRPRITEEMRLMRDEVAEVLNGEQKAAWSKWFREAERFRPGSGPQFHRGRERPEGGGGRPPGPQRAPSTGRPGDQKPPAGRRGPLKPETESARPAAQARLRPLLTSSAGAECDVRTFCRSAVA